MSLMKRIIPCLDVQTGRVVKGTRFIDLQDLGDPVALACTYEQEGADELVVLDISASLETRPTTLAVIERIAQNLSIPLTVGGGVRCLDDIARLLDAGADKISINSAALAKPDLIDECAAHYGAQCIVVAIDFHAAGKGGGVRSHGGQRRSERHVLDWAHEVCARGAGELLLTCIDRDGTGLGFERELTGQLARELSIPVIASGGAQSHQDFVDIFQTGVDAALAAGILHRRQTTISEIKVSLRNAGVKVRSPS